MKVTVYKERLLKGDSKYWGSQHENLATTLFFDFPEYVEKNGEDVPTAGLNKYIVFDTSRPNNQDVIKDGKYSFPHEITKLGTITFWIKFEEPSESEDMSDKLIWISKGLTVSFNENAEGQIEITNEKLDTFNSLVTTLNLEIKKVEDLVTEIETKLENGEFNGQDYVLTDQDKEEIVNTVKPMVETDMQPILEEIENTAKQAEIVAKGASQALQYLDYQDMVTNFNAFDKNKFDTSKNIMIKKLNVPDVWIYGVSEEYVNYEYTTDEDLINLLLSDTGLQVGYYVLSPLETQKVDLTEYTKQDQFVTLTQAEYDALTEKSANTYYFIIEEE